MVTNRDRVATRALDHRLDGQGPNELNNRRNSQCKALRVCGNRSSKVRVVPEQCRTSFKTLLAGMLHEPEEGDSRVAEGVANANSIWSCAILKYNVSTPPERPSHRNGPIALKC